MSGNVFRHAHRVTYAECTVGNHVYYARYLDFLEEARGEFFRSLGVPLRGLQEADTAFPAVESRLQYKSPARYDDVLRIELWLTNWTASESVSAIASSIRPPNWLSKAARCTFARR